MAAVGRWFLPRHGPAALSRDDSAWRSRRWRQSAGGCSVGDTLDGVGGSSLFFYGPISCQIVSPMVMMIYTLKVIE